MTPDIDRLLMLYPTLTIGEYFKLYPEKLKEIPEAPKEYEVLTESSAINEMWGTGELTEVKKQRLARATSQTDLFKKLQVDYSKTINNSYLPIGR